MSGLESLIAIIQEIVVARGVRAAVVGGAVRDRILQKADSLQDLDIVVEGDAIEIAEQVTARTGGQLKRFPDFRTAKIILTDFSHQPITEIDIASARMEVYPLSGALPKVTWATIEQDLPRRDFTINAIAVELSSFLSSPVYIDPTDGVADCRKKVVSIIHDESFADDPTRLFRAARYCARFDFSMDDRTKKYFQIAIDGNYLQTISTKRIFNELQKIFVEKTWKQTLTILNAFHLTHESLASFSFRDDVRFVEDAGPDGNDRYHTFIRCVMNRLALEQKKILAQKLSLTKAERALAGIG